ncbi:MAG: polysaccharide deacetylase family protein [Proteobacteria bacterium]|nr:polysaccharide deacetylase family protein [Pseudomonadota bacterium]
MTNALLRALPGWLPRLAPCLAAAFAGLMTAAPAAAGAAAVIVMYHRFGEDNIPATNIRIDQFEAHLDELATGGYTVLPVPDIITALRAGEALPNKTVGITIDDAYASVYAEAWPRLRAAGLPFTLFVSTDPVDRGGRGYMTWDQVREMAAAGVTIGHHGAAHAHMAYADAGTNAADIAAASRRFEDELGSIPGLFAYPFGEYSRALRDVVAAAGFTAAFGQHSGVAHDAEDRFALPRFALNERWGAFDRFKMVVNTLPLPVTDITPSDPLLGPNPPPFGFTASEELDNLDRLNCFASGQPASVIERLGARRFEVRIDAPFPPGRARINCTLPAPEGRYRWFGIQFLIPEP